MLPLLLAASLWAREADAQTVQPSVSFTKDDYLVYENAGTGTITVKLASTQPTSTTVRISATGNTATAGDDYVAFENVDLTIPAGGLTASHTVQILQDSLYENGDGLEGEDFHVRVISVNGVAPATAVETEVTIVDDEYTACFGSKTFLLEEDEGVYSLKLRLSRALPFPVKVTSTVVDYLATEDVDYEVLKGTYTFKPYTQDGAFEIWIKDDKVVETNELFRITALVPSVPDGEVFCSTDIIIRENDVVPRTVSLIEQGARKGQDIIEGANGALGLAHSAGIEVSAREGAQITNGADYVVEVCATSTTATRSADNTHTAGEDFVVQDTDSGLALANGCYSTDLSANLSKAAKNASSALQLKAFGDTVHEEPETVTVTLALKSNPGGLLELGTSTLTYTIRDNSPVFTITGGAAVTEGALAKFTVRADRVLTSRTNIWYTVSQEGDVVRTQDLNGGVPRAVVFLAGQQQRELEILTVNDNVWEQDGGYAKITLNPRAGYFVGESSSAVVKVNDDESDNSPVFTITGGAAVTEGALAKFTVRADRVLTSRTNIWYTVSQEGDVVRTQDLNGGVPRAVVFLAGQQQRELEILTVNDNVWEQDGGYAKITLNPRAGYFVGESSSAVVKVNDDESDNSPVFTITGGAAVTEGAMAKFTVRADRVLTSRTNIWYTVSQEGDVVRTQDLNGGVPRAVVFLAGQQQRELEILTVNDNVYEPKGGYAKITLNPRAGYFVGESPSAVVKVNDNDESNAYSRDCDPLVSSVSREKLTIRENNKNVRVINYPENGSYNCPLPGIDVFGTKNIPLPRGVSGTFQFSPAPTPDHLYIEPGWNDDKFQHSRLCGAVFNRGGHKYQLCVIDDENIPPATTEFKLLDGGRSISINEGQEATHKVIVGKPVAQTALPCFVWGELSVVRDILFDRGRALDSNGCMKSWPGTPHVGYVIMDLYINTNDDSLAGPNPRFDIGLKTTRKDGSAEPGATANSIGVTVVNDDHSEVVMVRPHPAPMTWVEVKEFFDNLSATAEDRKFSDGTFCNAETPGTRTVTAPGGSGSTRTCVKYFARHATHLKWSTGRATPFSYILRAWGPGEGGGRNFVTIAANTGYSAGKTALDQTAFACNSPEQRAREITISVREAADWSNELSSPALAPGSAKFPICAHEMPGRTYTYTDGSSLPVGVRSEPPKDVDQYPATEWSYQELPRAEIVVAKSNPYVDIRNARKTKFVKEGRRARFFVELSGEATQDVAVEWRVRPSVEHPRATLGEDVEKASGTLVIPQGETRGEIRVKTYEDSHDDDREKFRVRITSAEGAVIRQQRAHAIIRNDDPMPAAWLARFGRTVAEQALDGIAGRMAAPRTPGMQGTLAGQALGAGAPSGAAPGMWSGAGPGVGLAPGGDGTDVAGPGGLASSPGRLGTDGFGHDAAGFGNGFDETEPQSEPLTMRDALLGSRFTLTGAADGAGGSLALWGRASHGRFDGHEGTFSLDGEATTALLGADYARGGWLVGLALAQSEGEGAYRDTKTALRPASQDCPGGAEDILCGGAVREGDGTVEASLTAALPYASLEASERLKLWGALGYGAGEVTLATAMGGRYRADTTWRMAAAGLRGDLLEAPTEGSGPALALVSDALWARTASEKTLDLAASASNVTRLRLGLEGSWRMALDGGDAGAQPGASLTPKLELGARHDGGDAETGLGIELGGGIAWVHPALGLTLDVSGRTLIAHEDDALEDRGFAAALGFDPRPETERGPSFSLRQDFGGPASGGLDALFQPAPLDERSGAEATRRWTAEAAYGLPAFGGRWTASPHAGLGLSPDARDYTLGWRWTPAEGAHPLSFGLKATRRESDGAAPEHALGFEASARW